MQLYFHEIGFVAVIAKRLVKCSKCIFSFRPVKALKKTARVSQQCSSRLEHDHANTIHALLIQMVFLVDAAWYWRRPVIVKVVMQFAISSSELLVLQEHWVIKER